MNWNYNTFTGITDTTEEETGMYQYFKQSELLALAYLKHTRDHVVKRGFSYMAAFDGRHRSGKSVSACTLAYMWDPTFWTYFESRVVQDYTQFANAIEQIEKLHIKGAVIVCDEAGISMSSSDWYEKYLKAIAKMVQMFGYLCPIVLFIAPSKDFVDSRLRKMFHAYYKLNRYNNDYTTITPYELAHSTVKNKYFYKKPRVHLDGQEIVLRRMTLSRPPQFIIDRYKDLEMSRKAKMFGEFLNDIKKAEVKEQKEQVDIDKVITYVTEHIDVYKSKRSKQNQIILDEVKLEFGFKLTNRQAKYVKGEAENRLNQHLKMIAETTKIEAKE